MLLPNTLFYGYGYTLLRVMTHLRTRTNVLP
jgi:hypothetical protein